MKPMIILPPDNMSEADIKQLRDNDICVVVATDPNKVKFVDPIPAASSRTQIENAAIRLSRLLLNGQVTGGLTSYHGEIAKAYIHLLVEGTPLDRNGTREEQEQRLFDEEKAVELRRLARQEAKEERAKLKAEKLNQQAANKTK